jgi:hypothetical protein
MNEAYIELMERQARRGLRLLPDRAREVERRQMGHAQRKSLANSFGEWIANSLGPWDWFVNPISFRDRPGKSDENTIRAELRQDSVKHGRGQTRIVFDDPRLKNWKPHVHGNRFPGPPVADRALVEVKDWLFDLQNAACQPIRWMIAEEFGNVGGRYHCHVLVAGVSHLRRDEWWRTAFEQFGRTRISPFDPEQGGAFYAAKYAAKKLGALHFGGPPPHQEFSARMNPSQPVGRLSTTPSVSIPREEFRRYDGRPRGWSGWRAKR